MKIPLYKGSRSKAIVAYAEVLEEDFFRLNQDEWRAGKLGSPTRLKDGQSMGREILGLSREDKRKVFFKDGNRLNLRRENLEARRSPAYLRVFTPQQNAVAND